MYIVSLEARAKRKVMGYYYTTTYGWGKQWFFIRLVGSPGEPWPLAVSVPHDRKSPNLATTEEQVIQDVQWSKRKELDIRLIINEDILKDVNLRIKIFADINCVCANPFLPYASCRCS